MIVALAGRRIDAPDAPDAAVARFPPASVGRVRERIRDVLAGRGASTLVCSAACGADLLALDVAGGLGLRRLVLLSSPRDHFRATSVVDRPGDWGPLYDRVCDEVAARGDLIIMHTPGAEHEGYLRVTYALVDEALALARRPAPGRPGAEGTLAVLVWEGAPRGPDDLTATFGEYARERGLPLAEILTR